MGCPVARRAGEEGCTDLQPLLFVFYTEAREGEDRVIAWAVMLLEESPDFMGRALGNSQAERSDTSTTENKPPMAKAMRHQILSLQLR